MKRFIAKAATAAIVGLGATVGAANAAIVCDNDGNCWHVKDKYEYPPSAELLSTRMTGSGKTKTTTAIAGASTMAAVTGATASG